jgi:UDP-glucose:(heptosyl)LPS alpha-1,3-glucosyltransferase
VERAVWEGLRYLGARYPTTFVGDELERDGLPAVAHQQPRRVAWGRGPLQPIAFRASARERLPRQPGHVTASFGANTPPGHVFVVNSLHRSWLRHGQRVHLRGFDVPNTARYALPHHEILLALEWIYFRRGHPRAVIAVSDLVATELAQLYGITHERISVIPNGFDPEQCNPTRRRALRGERRAALGIADDAVVSLFVANELHRKGFGVLLETLARLDTTPLEVHVVGRTPLSDYRPRIAELGLERRVHYHGTTSDIGLFHAAADLLVLPTQYEAFALTIVEALASGLPVITTTVPGAGDLICDDVNGLLQHDPSDAEELTNLLAMAVDPSRRERWAEAAPGSVAGYEWATLMARYEQVLLGVA